MLVFGERRKPEYPGKNLFLQSREPANSTHVWQQVRELNPSYIDGRRVLSPLHQSCWRWKDLVSKESVISFVGGEVKHKNLVSNKVFVLLSRLSTAYVDCVFAAVMYSVICIC